MEDTKPCTDRLWRLEQLANEVRHWYGELSLVYRNERRQQQNLERGQDKVPCVQWQGYASLAIVNIRLVEPYLQTTRTDGERTLLLTTTSFGDQKTSGSGR